MRKILSLGLCLVLVSILTAANGQAEEVDADHIRSVIKSTLASINEVKTYQFLLVKRELVEGRDTGHQYLTCKVQTEPLRVYLKFLKPDKYAGREALYTTEPFENLIVRRGGTRSPNLVLNLKPDSVLAMDGNRYPITHMDPKMLSKQLVERIEHELQFPDTTLEKRYKAKYDGQVGDFYQLVHKTKAEGQDCQAAMMLISEEHNLPIYFKVYDWNNRVVEEYAFSRVIVNAPLEPAIFDEENPNYGFKREVRETEQDSNRDN